MTLSVAHNCVELLSILRCQCVLSVLVESGDHSATKTTFCRLLAVYMACNNHCYSESRCISFLTLMSYVVFLLYERFGYC